MAEAVGLAASIIAVAGVATAVLELVAEVKSFARDYKTVRKDLNLSVGHLSFTAGTINVAQETLLRYCKDTNTVGQSAVINFIEDKKACDYLRTASSRLEHHVWQLHSEIESLLSIPFTLWVNWRWRRSLRSGIEALRSSMMFMQQNLALLVDIIQLELALGRKDKNEIEM